MSKPRNSQKRVNLLGTADKLESEFATLEAADKRGELQVIVLRVLAGVSVLVGGMAFVSFKGELPLAGAIICAIGFLIAQYVIGKGDLEDRKLELARTFVKVFGPECKSGRPISVKIDFHGYWNPKGDDHWLDLRMVLANGITAQLVARTDFKRKTRQKRKYTKIKDKITERIIVRLIPAKGQALDPRAQSEIPTGQLSAMSLRNSKITAKAATFVFITPPLMRIQGRSDYSEYDRMPSGKEAVQAMIISYHLLGIASARTAT